MTCRGGCAWSRWARATACRTRAAALGVEDKVGLRAGLDRRRAAAWSRRARSCRRSWVPQMAGSDEVLRRACSRPGVRLPVLVPNRQGFEARARPRARARSPIFTAASETFNRKNINASIDESFARFAEFVPDARRDGLWVRGYVSTCFGCPYEGARGPGESWSVVAPARPTSAATRSRSATPSAWPSPPRCTDVMGRLTEAVPRSTAWPSHFHDTRGTALANVLAALRRRASTVVDSSAGGLGRLSLCAGRQRQPRDRRPPLHAARDGHRAPAWTWTRSRRPRAALGPGSGMRCPAAISEPAHALSVAG